jgi:hypothetical protein
LGSRQRKREREGTYIAQHIYKKWRTRLWEYSYLRRRERKRARERERPYPYTYNKTRYF